MAGLVGCLDSFSVKNVIGADYVQDTKIYQSFETRFLPKDLTSSILILVRIFLLEAVSLQFFLLSPSAAMIMTILLLSDWKTELTIFFLQEMLNLPVRKRSVILALIFPVM